MSDHRVRDGIFECGNITLQSGMTLPAAKIVYRTYGTLSAARDNVIVYPTSYGAQHSEIEWLIAPGRALDPDRYFIVIPNMFGNGLSTSPSTATPPYNKGRFPRITAYDNVMQQRRLLREMFGVERVAMVYGWSMGAQQAYHWAALAGADVARIVVNCGSARTSPHNFVFLEGVKATLTADPAWAGDHFAAKPERGLRAMGRVYAGWAMSQTFYREALWRQAGYASLEDFLVGSWEGNFLRRDGDDLLCQLWTWQNADIARHERFGGDLAAALSAVEAKVLLMPSATDLYFQTADNRLELPHLRRGVLREIPSVWGHRAGNPRDNSADAAFIDNAVKDLLADG
ncbi:MAG: alpha/beta fold hydrolase [Alphaproteobacteria bacterium]|nr:alpha/beta fold hydrolase [Alphaproteobacteria bacterium]